MKTPKAKSKKPRLNVHQISCPDIVWHEAGTVLSSIGISRSAFITIILRYVSRSGQETMGETFEGIFQDVFKEARLLKQE